VADSVSTLAVKSAAGTLTIVIACALALGAGEIAVRAVGSTDAHRTFVLRGRRIMPYRFSSEAYRDLQQQGQEGYDSILGWVQPPRFDAFGAHRPRDTEETLIDGGGANFSLGPLGNGLRIVLIGDSYTYGDEVEFVDSWGHVLEKRLNQAGVSAEVINLGVGGYGMDQAYLRWIRHGRALKPTVLVFGMQPENLKRNVNIFRPFYTLPPAGSGVFLTKPRFVQSGDSLVLKNVPTMSSDAVADFVDHFENHPLAAYEAFRTLEHESERFWMKSKLLASARMVWRVRARDLKDYPDSLFFGVDSEAYNLGLAIIDEMRCDAGNHGAEFLVLHLPRARQDVIRHTQGEPRVYEQFLTEVKRRHAVIDPFYQLLTTVREGSPADIHMPNGHYSPAANHIVGSLLADRLIERLVVGRAGAKKRIYPRPSSGRSAAPRSTACLRAGRRG
jgi:hypothetical protein